MADELEEIIQLPVRRPKVRKSIIAGVIPIDFSKIKEAIITGFREYEIEKYKLLGKTSPLFLFKLMKFCPGTNDSVAILRDIIIHLTSFCFKTGLNYESYLRTEVDDVIHYCQFDYEFYTLFVDHCLSYYINFDYLFVHYLNVENWAYAEYLLLSRKITRLTSFFDFIADMNFESFLKLESAIGQSCLLDDYTVMFLKAKNLEVYEHIYNHYITRRKQLKYIDYNGTLHTYLLNKTMFYNDIEKTSYLIVRGAVPTHPSELEDFILYSIKEGTNATTIDIFIECLLDNFGNKRMTMLYDLIESHVPDVDSEWLHKIDSMQNHIVPETLV